MPSHPPALRSGPALETLLRRLVDIPPDFLDEPRIGSKGRVFVAALVCDLLAMHGHRAGRAELSLFGPESVRADRNRLALVMIVVWLLADDWFLAQGFGQTELLRICADTAGELAAASAAHQFSADPDRREELVRVVLTRLGYRPAGETDAQARDRLSALSGVERQRLLEASRVAEERARAIREALVKKAAEESADKWTRE